MIGITRRGTAVLLGAALTLGAPAGFVLAANAGSGVSAIAQDGGTGEAHGTAVSDAAQQIGAQNDNTNTNEPNTDANDHGTAVSTAAQDQSLVGGANDNHGGYVSGIASAGHADGAGSTGTSIADTAKDSATTGGTQDNHGGAVEGAAR